MSDTSISQLTDFDHPRTGGLGLFYGAAAYGLWGLLPLYLDLLKPAGAMEIIAHRIVWCLIFCLAAISVTRGWKSFFSVIHTPQLMGILSIAAILVTSNWTVYVYAVGHNLVVDAALGYFLNPIISVVLGVFLLHEQLRRAQWAAIVISALAVIVIMTGYGKFPWVALAVSVSFSLYGYVKKRVGSQISALDGLTVETGVLTIFAIIFLIYLNASHQQHFFNTGFAHGLGMLGLGVVTAVPLLLFNASTRRLPLSIVGLLQFITPIMQFILGLWIFHEPMSLQRWAGFILIWLALIVFVADGIFSRRNIS